MGRVGLGVAIAKRIVEAYGGELIFESREKKGATISARFPAKS